MTDRELMQQALEALNHVNVQDRVQVIAALRERLAQPEQEPVWIQPNHLQKARQAPFLCRVEPAKRDDFVPLYTAPPKQWVGLTDEEIEHIADSEWEEAFVRMIEAKLKEKNHG